MACYINGIACISAQPSFEKGFLEDVSLLKNENVVYAKQPSYKEYITPAAIRRMSKGVKMGIAAAAKAMTEAQLEMPDVIITGTGMGCVEDSEKFLKGILNNNEQFLTPTSFIQSTHNTVGAQIALGLQCYGYNFTYVNGSVSFESALLDANMQINSGEAGSILVGGVDETAQHTLALYKLINIIKKEEDAPYSVLDSESKGVVFSEGAGFFVLENEKRDSSYAEIQDITFVNSLSLEEVECFITGFLKSNALSEEDIDTVVLGNNGDCSFDDFYNVSGSLFKDIPQVYYKHLSGEYNTASAFGFWTTLNILKEQQIPEILKMNSLTRKKYDTVLIYNQYRGKDHSLILLKRC